MHDFKPHPTLGSRPNTLAWLRDMQTSVLTLFLATVCITGCKAYVPGQSAYWDERIQGLCEKDGGIVVYETVRLTGDEYAALGGRSKGLSIPTKSTWKPGFPYLRERHETTLHKQSPEVVRSEERIVRVSDGKVLGTTVHYWRRGGDLPTGLGHESYFICPKDDFGLSNKIFKVEGGRNDR